MKLFPVGLLCLYVVVSLELAAQPVLLNERDALEIVEAVPAVAAGQRNRLCPLMSLQKWTPFSYWIAVRSACGEWAGQLISNYVVDRRSGNVTIGETIPMEPPPREFLQARDSVLQRARVRRWRTNEIQCIVEDAVRRKIGTVTGMTSVSLNPAMGDQENIFLFNPVITRDDGIVIAIGEMEVDIGAHGPRFRGVAFDHLPAETIFLGQMMEETKYPEALRDADVLALARTIDWIRRVMDKPCVATTLELSRRSSEYVLSFTNNIDCVIGELSGDSIIFIHRHSGVIRDARSGEVLSSSATEALRLELVRRLTSQAQYRTDAIRRRCPQI